MIYNFDSIIHEFISNRLQLKTSELFGVTNEDAMKSVIRFNTEKTSINDQTATQTSEVATEEEPYCPPTPIPKKSILKDFNVVEKNKQVNRMPDLRI